MNLLTDVHIVIDFTKIPKETDKQLRRTIVGATENIATVFVLVFELHPDFAKTVETALEVYKQRASKP